MDLAATVSSDPDPRTLCRGDGWSPAGAVVGVWVGVSAEACDMESTTASSSSCFRWMAWSWRMTSSRLVLGEMPLEAMMGEREADGEQTQVMGALCFGREKRCAEQRR